MRAKKEFKRNGWVKRRGTVRVMKSDKVERPLSSAQGEALERLSEPRGIVVALRASDLCDNWGFDDGDILSTEFIKWARERSEFKEDLARYSGCGDDFSLGLYSPYLSSHTLLIKIVENEIVSKLDDKYKRFVKRYLTSHNPIRADEDEIESPGDLMDYMAMERALERIGVVEINEELFDRYASELFPYREIGYIRLFEAVYLDFERYTYLDSPINQVRRESISVFEDETQLCRRYLDERVVGYSDEVLGLSSEIIAEDKDELSAILLKVDKLIYR